MKIEIECISGFTYWINISKCIRAKFTRKANLAISFLWLRLSSWNFIANYWPSAILIADTLLLLLLSCMNFYLPFLTTILNIKIIYSFFNISSSKISSWNTIFLHVHEVEVAGQNEHELCFFWRLLVFIYPAVRLTSNPWLYSI